MTRSFVFRVIVVVACVIILMKRLRLCYDISTKVLSVCRRQLIIPKSFKKVKQTYNMYF